MLKKRPQIKDWKCISCGDCEKTCPEVFMLDRKYGCAGVHNPAGASVRAIQKAMDFCPAGCIEWV